MAEGGETYFSAVIISDEVFGMFAHKLEVGERSLYLYMEDTLSCILYMHSVCSTELGFAFFPYK